MYISLSLQSICLNRSHYSQCARSIASSWIFEARKVKSERAPDNNKKEPIMKSAYECAATRCSMSIRRRFALINTGVCQVTL